MKFRHFCLLQENDEKGLIDAIKANPTNTTNWLVYADFLEEQSDNPLSQVIHGLLLGQPNIQTIDDAWREVWHTQLGSLLTQVSPVANYAYTFTNRRHTLSLSGASRIAQIIEQPCRTLTQAYPKLEEINELIGGFGVEAIGEQVLYVNMGDCYASTILFDPVARKLILTSWADWVEVHEEDY